MRTRTILILATLSLLALPVEGGFPQATPAFAAEPTVAPQIAQPAGPLAVEPLRAFIDPAAAGVSPDVLQLALSAVTCAVAQGDIDPPRTLTLIDYSRPSLEPRLWVFDLTDGRLLFKELVAHGRNTGDNMATQFSDSLNSYQSSIGLFVARDTYVGSNGYSLRLDGLEPGFNGRARERAIVMHGAPYVNAVTGASQGRLGRSLGCPALREAIARDVIDTLQGGGIVFSYYPDADWLRDSRFLGGCPSHGETLSAESTSALARKGTDQVN